MNKRIIWVYLVVLIGASIEANAQKNKSFTVKGKEIDAVQFDRRMQSIMADAGISGMSLAVINNNKVVYSSAYGNRLSNNAAPVNNATVFEAASLTKTFLLFAVYRLVDQGRLDLDKPMHQYMEFEPLKHDERYRLITPRMVLNHTAGVENWRRYNNPDLLEIVTTPGEGYSYSGEAYQYLAQVVDLVLHRPYEKYIKKMVVRPLRLQHTFLAYKRRGSFPKNYAVGHDSFGRPLDKWKNVVPEPASGIHLVASDYAKLIVALFDQKRLSDRIIKDVRHSHVLISEDNVRQVAGPGFNVLRTAKDTILIHGGNNDGFRASVFYSLTDKSGLVFLTNSDRGDLIGKQLNALTVGLDIGSKFENDPMAQYPSNANTLLKTFNQKGAEEMMSKLGQMKLQTSNDIGVQTLNELGYLFFASGNKEIAMRLFEENIRLYPESSIPYYFLGLIKMERRDYDVAYQHFKKAQELRFQYAPLDMEISTCENKLEEGLRRTFTMVEIGPGEASMLEAENFRAMSGIEAGPTADVGGGEALGYIDAGNWMDYQVNVTTPGIYRVGLRVASLPGDANLQLRCGDQVLATVEIPSTQGWQNWTTLETDVTLHEGSQVLRIFNLSGSFNVNWLKFSPVAPEANN